MRSNAATMPLGSLSNARKRRRIAGILRRVNSRSARVELERRKLLVGLQRRTDHMAEAMFALLKRCSARIAVICIAMAPLTGQTLAISVEVAKKCNALTAKAFPPRQVGNPAAGVAGGTGGSQRDYFNKCVANGGKMDDQGSEGSK
jgi:hypothetical protein